MDFKDALESAKAWEISVPGVAHVAEGVAGDTPCITVFVSSPEPARTLPRTVGAWPVVLAGVYGRNHATDGQ